MISQLCGLLGHTKQAYYQRIQYEEQKAFDTYLLKELVIKARLVWKRGSGRNLFTYMQRSFKEHQIKIGRDKFFEFLRENGLLIMRKSRQAVTTNSYHFYHRYPNLIKEKVALKSNEIWVCDITYIWIVEKENFGYLSIITDLYSHRIMGYCLHATLKAIGPLTALKMAIKVAGKNSVKKCIHHSDRGIQYCCNEYISAINKYGLIPSMTENGDPLENPVAERINGILKHEFSNEKEMQFESMAIAKKQMDTFVQFYNTQRPHGSIERLTPIEAYSLERELKKTWKNYKKLKWEREKTEKTAEKGDLERHMTTK